LNYTRQTFDISSPVLNSSFYTNVLNARTQLYP